MLGYTLLYSSVQCQGAHYCTIECRAMFLLLLSAMIMSTLGPMIAVLTLGAKYKFA